MAAAAAAAAGFRHECSAAAVATAEIRGHGCGVTTALGVYDARQ